jgi:hypothetical protein
VVAIVVAIHSIASRRVRVGGWMGHSRIIRGKLLTQQQQRLNYIIAGITVTIGHDH